MQNRQTAANQPSKAGNGPELVFSRAFAAPVAAVYRAWTDPEALVHWWGPKGFTMTIHRMELEVGGVWEYVLHGPDGTDYPNEAVFEEIVPLKRLVYFNRGGHVDDAHLTSRMIATFEERDGLTLVSLRMQFEGDEALERAKARGADRGGRESFERLQAWLEKNPANQS